MVEGARLESVYAVTPYRGFESHPLRHVYIYQPAAGKYTHDMMFIRTHDTSQKLGFGTEQSEVNVQAKRVRPEGWPK